MEGKSSLALTIASRTSEVEHAAARCGHPALDSLAAAWAAGQPAGLRVTLTPDWFADGGQTCFEFIGENNQSRVDTRSLLHSPELMFLSHITEYVPFEDTRCQRQRGACTHGKRVLRDDDSFNL